MRLRGLLLVVLALLVLGGFVHAPLHAGEANHDDCPLALFCSGAAAVVVTAALVVAGLAAQGRLPEPRPVVLRAYARSARGARGPPRS